jgi:long-chain acyl-CoA synthetase
MASKRDFSLLLRYILLQRIKFVCGVPEVYNLLTKAQLPWYFHYFHAVHGFICGGAPLARETLLNFQAKFRRGQLLQGYGISECSPVVAVNTPWANRPGSVGKALPGYEVRCFSEEMQAVGANEIGEIWVKGDCVMQGYYKQPEASAAVLVNGWLRTGDIGRIDDDGFIYIIDRIKDVIINKGMNIYPREIEEVIYTHPKVNACAVIGVKDDAANELPHAYIELKEQFMADEAEFKAFLRPQLAAFKQPRRIFFLEKIPRTATGKILKRKLRDRQRLD